MNIPTPNEYAKDHGHNPFPPRWERWLSAARLAILSAQPAPGRHVSVDEHLGKGTVINIYDTSTRRGGGGGPILGACCYNDGTCDDLTEADCTEAGGNWQGLGTTCADDPNPCEPPCNGCGFDAFDGSGRKFLTSTETKHVVKIQSCLSSDTCERGTDATYVFTSHYDSDCGFTSTVELFGDAEFNDPFYEERYHNCDGTTIVSAAPDCTPSFVSATEQHCSDVTNYNHPTCTPTDTSLTITIDVVLSDECTP